MMEVGVAFLTSLGFKRTERDKNMMKLINNMYKSTRIVGRGTLKVSSSEVGKSDSFKQAQKKAERLVKQNTY